MKHWHIPHHSKRWYAGAALISSLLMAGSAEAINVYQSRHTQTLLVVNGLKSISESELKSQVRELGITAFWVGPEEGDQYLLDTSTRGQVSIKYVRAGVSLEEARDSLREIITFSQVGAFEIVRDYPTTDTSLSFINADGNSVFIDSSARSSIYIGIKGRDFQVSMFDPKATRNLALASEKGRLVQIK